jgi:hypothetical protein
MKAILRSGFLALVITALAVPAHAGPFEDGLGALQRGDYATALEIWIPLAEKGHAGAQSNLGTMYHFGQGVPPDYVSAHMWFTFSAAQGYENAQEKRDFVAKRMTPDQIAEAQRMAREWMAKHQQ